MHHAGKLGTTAGFDIDNGTHGSASAGKTTEESSHSIANTLPYQLTVRVVLGLGDIVSHHRGEQSVDGTETRKRKTRDDGCREDGAPVETSKRHLGTGEERHGKSRGNLANDSDALHIDEQRNNGHHNESHQR